MYSHTHWKNTQCCSKALCFSDVQIKQDLYSCAGTRPFVAFLILIIFCSLNQSSFKLPHIITFAKSLKKEALLTSVSWVSFLAMLALFRSILIYGRDLF